MSNSGKSGSGRGNNRRRPFRHKNNSAKSQGQTNDKSAGQQAGQGGGRSLDQVPASDNQHRSNRGGSSKRNNDRPKWHPPKINPEALPPSDCLYCGKPIRDMTSAMADRDTGKPIHFECVTSRIATGENLDKGESVVYIGGGRFGIVSFDSARDNHGKAEVRDFKIKKVIEWENKDTRAEWRSVICDHYSVTNG